VSKPSIPPSANQQNSIEQVGTASVFESEIKAAKDVLELHIEALNARDEERLAATLHFPHFRLSGAELKTWKTPDCYFEDFRERAGNTWARSVFNKIRTLQASSDKVHFDVEVNRYDTEGQVIVTFRSLWVITLEQQRWAAKFRSSFATQ